MAAYDLDVSLLVGNSIPISEAIGIDVAHVSIGPAYEFQREDGQVNWPAVTTYKTSEASLTIPGLVDVDSNGDKVTWQIRPSFMKGNSLVSGGTAKTFQIPDGKTSPLAYPADVTFVDPDVNPEYGPTWAEQALAARDEAVAAAADAAAFGGTNNTQVAAFVSTPGPTATALSNTFVSAWKATTAYASGAQVKSPSGDIVAATSAHTSGSSYDPTKWTLASSLVYTKAAVDSSFTKQTVACTIPTGVGWVDGTIAPSFVLWRDALRLVGDAGLLAKALFNASGSTALTAPTTTYYVTTTGSDSANGLTLPNALRSITKAVELGNLTAQPYKVLVSAGDYLMTNGFNAVSPTSDVAFVAVGGPVRTGALYDYATAFAPSSTYTQSDTATNPREIRLAHFINTSSWTGSAARVLDRTSLKSNGLFEELVRVETPGLCSITPGSFYQGTLPTGGSALLIHRNDGAIPDANNTIIVRNIRNFYCDQQINLYVGSQDGSPWEFWGGDNTHAYMDTGAIMLFNQNATTARKFAIFENVHADYAGREKPASTSINCNGVSIQKWNGLTAFFNSSAHAASKDGFNAHNTTSTAGGGTPAAKVALLTVNCESFDCGRGLNISCNSLTLHENVVGIDIAGTYKQGRGGTIRNVGSSKQLLVGTRVEGDLGDFLAGGTSLPADIRIDETAELWAFEVAATGRWAATGSGKIHRHNCQDPRVPDFGDGTFDTY